MLVVLNKLEHVLQVLLIAVLMVIFLAVVDVVVVFLVGVVVVANSATRSGQRIGLGSS